MPSRFLPSPIPASQILADLICTPVSMRTDRFFALVRDLASGNHPHRTLTTGIQARTVIQPAAFLGDSDDEHYVYPWEEPIYAVQNGVALVQVEGALVKGYDAMSCWCYGLMSIDRLQEAIAEISARTDITCVILKLNTPGGMSLGMPETSEMLVELGKTRLVIAHTSDTAASNGMRLAVACNLFLPTSSAMVGCIGTYIALYDFSAALTEMGVKLELFRDGELKGIGITGKELTDKERKFLADEVLACGKIFKDFVRAQRGAIADDVMQGQWFTGAVAVTHGLADRTVTGLTEVLQEVQTTLQTA